MRNTHSHDHDIFWSAQAQLCPLRISAISGVSLRHMKTRSVARARLTTCKFRNIVNMILTSDKKKSRVKRVLGSVLYI